MSQDLRPALVRLLENPARLGDISAEEAVALAAELAGIQSAIAARLVSPVQRRLGRADETDTDSLLDPRQASERLGVSVRWLYRHAGKLPFTRRLSRKVLKFSRRGIEKYLAEGGRL